MSDINLNEILNEAAKHVSDCIDLIRGDKSISSELVDELTERFILTFFSEHFEELFGKK